LFKKKSGKRLDYLCSGAFLAIQFVSAVYLAIFTSAAIAIYFATGYFRNNYSRKTLKGLIIVFLTFIAIDFIFIKGYIRAHRDFGIKRNYSEYVTYSAHLTDFVFSNNIKSVVHNNQILDKWNRFNRHSGGGAGFPGFLISILALSSLITISYKKSKLKLKVNLSNERLFFFIITVIGLVFSLGPRVNFNGNYAEIPLPYHFLVKYFPFFDNIRTPIRWVYLFYIGTTYFALDFLKDKKDKLIFLFFIVAILEYLPFNLPTHSENYLSNSHMTLKKICDNKKDQVLLQYPVTHFDAGDDILEGLNYVSKSMLASTYHGCRMVNGYSGFDLPSLLKLKDDLSLNIKNNNHEEFYDLIKRTNSTILLADEEKIVEHQKTNLKTIISNLEDELKLIRLENNLYEIR
jgi:hypothetical protein